MCPTKRVIVLTLLHLFRCSYQVTEPASKRYEVCNNPVKHIKDVGVTGTKYKDFFVGSNPGKTGPKEYYSIDSRLLPFSCYNMKCSPENEAYYLGIFAIEQEKVKGKLSLHFLMKNPAYPKYSGSIRANWVLHLSQFWKQLKQMQNSKGEQIKSAQRYTVEDTEKDLYSSHTSRVSVNYEIVPLVCDPRAYLYCEYSVWNVEPTEKKQLFRRPSPNCRCHPLYSFAERDTVNQGVKYICKGRHGTPCKFSRSTREKNNQMPTNRDDEYIRSKHNISADTDREKHLIDSVDLDDLGLHGDVGLFESICEENSTCIYMEHQHGTKIDEFRHGNDWHGFGLNPIMREMMSFTATKICSCTRNKYKSNNLFSCIESNP